MSETTSFTNVDGFILAPKKPEFVIQGENSWLMKITQDDKIVFNHEEFPDMAADDFAKEVIKILEQSFCYWRGA